MKSNQADGIDALRLNNRAVSWRLAEEIAKRDISVWRLERLKLVVARADDALLRLPDSDLGRFSISKSLQGVAALLVAFALLIAYLLRHRGGAGQALPLSDGARRLAALHGEVSTRTRHLLRAMQGADPPFSAVILLGRLKRNPAEAATLWESEVQSCRLNGAQLLLPMSPIACVMALVDLPALVAEGLLVSARSRFKIGFRDQVAVAFRVFLGAVSARWWMRYGADRPREVIFAITGTADTTLFERAIQRSGGRTVHVVHGQATGPNFLGISDVAYFRSRHDAEAYEKVGCYGRCSYQPAMQIGGRRGASGLTLMSNLAHPMNPEFAKRPIKSEVALLTCVGSVARLMGAVAQPLLWKPHPVFAQLPKWMQDELNSVATREGFTNIMYDQEALDSATLSRWVLSSPSTVALDLLQGGILPVILDPQCSVLDTALAGLPIGSLDASALTDLLMRLNDDAAYHAAAMRAFSVIGPAKALDLLTINKEAP